MGNNTSTSSQERRREERRRRQRRRENKEVDSDDECNHNEVFDYEIDTGRIDESSGAASYEDRKFNKCRELYGEKLIPLKEFILDHLPLPLKDQQVLNYIRSQEKIVVKLHVLKTEKFRDDASGWACVSTGSVQVFPSCPIRDCRMNGGKNHEAYGGITVYTNVHVIENDSEAANCEVMFFCDEKVSEKDFTSDKISHNTSDPILSTERDFQSKGDIKSQELQSSVNVEQPKLMSNHFVKAYRAQGLTLGVNNNNKDLVALNIVFHDPQLFDIVATCNKERSILWSKMSDKLKTSMKQHAIVISHPHGRPKHVSVGRLTSVEEENLRPFGKVRETRYEAATCSGSSGAPVFSGHYVHRPFTHSGKGLRGNMSLSY